MNTETNNDHQNPEALDPKIETAAVDDSEAVDLSAEGGEDAVALSESEAGVPLGQRLRAAREARGWTREEVASKLRLPAHVVQSLESGDWQRTSYSIYLRGYLTSYTRLVGLPTILVDSVLHEHGQTPQLVTSSPVSKSRYLFDRYSVSALYLILTGVIIVPAVLLAMRTTFEPNMAQFTPLDAPVNAARDVAIPDARPANPAQGGEIAENHSAQAKLAASDATAPTPPLIASMTPFPPASTAQPSAASEAAAPAAEGHKLHLVLRDASWVEIVATDGRRLEYGLLPAGTERTYTSDKPLDVRLGNSVNATVEIDGKAEDLAPYRYAAVAHFKLFAGQTISHAD